MPQVNTSLVSPAALSTISCVTTACAAWLPTPMPTAIKAANNFSFILISSLYSSWVKRHVPGGLLRNMRTSPSTLAGGAFSSVETRGAWARNLHWKRPLLIVPRPRKTGFFPLQSGVFRGVPPRLAAGLAVCLQRRRLGAVQHEKEPLLGSVNTRRAVPE